MTDEIAINVVINALTNISEKQTDIHSKVTVLEERQKGDMSLVKQNLKEIHLRIDSVVDSKSRKKKLRLELKEKIKFLVVSLLLTAVFSEAIKPTIKDIVWSDDRKEMILNEKSITDN